MIAEVHTEKLSQCYILRQKHWPQIVSETSYCERITALALGVITEVGGVSHPGYFAAAGTEPSAIRIAQSEAGGGKICKDGEIQRKICS